MNYPELNKLIALQKTYQLKVVRTSEEKKSGLIPATLYSGKFSWNILIDDEYRYFDEKKPLLCLYLALLSLEDYEEADDFLVWCNYYGINTSDNFYLEYYKSLDKTFKELSSILGEIDACISTLDYQLRSGAFASLLKL